MSASGRVRPIAALAVALVAAGCSSPIFAPGSPGPDATASPPRDAIHQQAHDALERWAAAVRDSGGASITFVGELTSQIGNWEQAVGDNNKTALMAGFVQAKKPLSDDRPSDSEVKWVDGRSQDVNVLSAAEALADLVAAGEMANCAGDCRALIVTEANLARGLVETSQGPAEVPIWVFTIEDTAVRVTRVAVDDSVTVDPPPWNVEDPPLGVSIEGATGTADSDRLEVAFVGAPDGADKPCGADYTAEAVESDLAIVVIVKEKRNPAPGPCTLVGSLRTASVRLEAPLGKRAVLEVRQGLPVPLRPS